MNESNRGVACLPGRGGSWYLPFEPSFANLRLGNNRLVWVKDLAMADLNKVFLMGSLTFDPELRRTPVGNGGERAPDGDQSVVDVA